MNDKMAVLVAACMSSFITPFLTSSVTVALPAINSEFSIPDQSLLGWIVTAFLLSAAIFIVPFGRIADIYGRRRVFLAGLVVVIVSSLLCSISTGVHMLIASRMVEGVGSAMIFGTSIAILASVFPLRERGRVLGINVAAAYLGLSTGPLLGGVITAYAGWRFIYLAVAVYSLLALVIARWKIKGEWKGENGKSFDIAGTLLYTAMLSSLIYGLTLIPDRMGAVLLLFSGATMILFFRWESGNANPVLKVRPISQ